MAWNPPSGLFAGGTAFATYSSPNHAAYSSPNHAAYGSPNHAAYGSPNHAAYGSPNHAAFFSPNHAAYGSPNHAAYGSPNHAAYNSPNHAAWFSGGGATGAGMPSGAGFLGGYGTVIRSDYATPASLGPLPWTLDFAAGNGWPGFPTAHRLNPADFNPPLQFKTSDWDPGLRFWTLPFDTQLTEWLQDLNLAAPAVMVAREFAAQHAQWRADLPGAAVSAVSAVQSQLDPNKHLGWLNANRAAAWSFINRELTELEDLMVDDRFRYLPEADLQSSNIPTYFMHLMGIDAQQKPWTVELMNCASAVANLLKMHYKSVYRRVRPSVLCPGLVPPWGPPMHPAFPSGHSMVAHLTALFLLSLEPVAQRLGVFDGATQNSLGRKPVWADFVGNQALAYGENQQCPLLWLAWRVAKNRERLGVHYPSDSAASQRLAAAVWESCLGAQSLGVHLELPSLHRVLVKAAAEW
jgi:hypothetical protein